MRRAYVWGMIITDAYPAQRPLLLLDFDGVCAKTEFTARNTLSSLLAEQLNLDQAQVFSYLLTRPGLRVSQLFDDLQQVFDVAIADDLRDWIPREQDRLLIQRFREDGVDFGANMPEVLRRLVVAFHARICICSNSSLPRLDAAIDGIEKKASPAGLTLRELTSIIYSAKVPKPDPQVYLQAIADHERITEAAPSAVLIVEDSAAGALAGLRAAKERPDLKIETLGFVGLSLRAEEAAEDLVRIGVETVIRGDDWSFLPPIINRALKQPRPFVEHDHV